MDQRATPHSYFCSREYFILKVLWCLFLIPLVFQQSGITEFGLKVTNDTLGKYKIFWLDFKVKINTWLSNPIHIMVEMQTFPV